MKIILDHINALAGLLGLANPAFVNYALFNRIGSGGVVGKRIYALLASLLGYKTYLIVGDNLEETIGVARGQIHEDNPSIITYPDDSLYCLGTASKALKPSYKWDDGLLVNDGHILNWNDHEELY